MTACPVGREEPSPWAAGRAEGGLSSDMLRSLDVGRRRGTRERLFCRVRIVFWDDDSSSRWNPGNMFADRETSQGILATSVET